MKWKRLKNLFLVLVTALSYCEGCSFSGDLEEVTFYEGKYFEGARLIIKFTSRCFSLGPDWDDRISSVDTQGHCIIAYESRNCRGDSIKLAPGIPGLGDLHRLRFNKDISSFKKCPDTSQGRGSRLGRNKGTTNFDDLIKACVLEHNKYRRMHGVRDLAADAELNQLSQAHANYLARTNRYETSPQKRYGENLGTSSRTNKEDAMKEVVRKWYDKMEFYNFEDHDDHKNAKAAYFVNLVWKNSRDLGVGIAWNAKEKKWIVVCMYNPPAIKEHFWENVPLPIRPGVMRY